MQFTIDLPLGVIEPVHEFQSAEAAPEMGRALERAGIAALSRMSLPRLRDER